MEKPKIITEETLAHARDLLKGMESGDETSAQAKLDELLRVRETGLYQELGKLTRDLHDTLNSFQLDARLSNIAEQEIPDARERLNYVISMTDKAANTTLNCVEESIPIVEDMEQQGIELHSEWKRFTQRELDVQAFRKLSSRIDGFLTESTSKAGRLKSNLNDVLMAQDFQDLTGQIIKRVITLVEEVEGNLVNLIRLTGAQFQAQEQNEKSKEEKKQEAIAAQGPVVPGVSEGDVMSGQDDVDDLLSSLGF